MITYAEIDGFKSLSKFQIGLNPGLNILVGPNGSGKTNIVSFFEFLTNLVESDASEATSRAGGAGAVFRRTESKYEKEIVARVMGCFEESTGGRPRRNRRKDQFLCYEYIFTLQFPDTRDSVLFVAQRLRARQTANFFDERQSLNAPWELNVSAYITADGNQTVTIDALDEALIDFPMFDKKSGANERQKQLENFVAQMLSQNVSLINVFGRFSFLMHLLVSDITAGRVYNIVPTRIKIPEDSAKAPGIGRDGSGLSATLYAIQSKKEINAESPWGFYVSPPRSSYLGSSSFEQLKDYLRVVNSAIEDIQVNNDPFDNQLRVAFRIRSGDYCASVPLALMSDGTLKWIALVTAALTARSVFSIEEPENYLHPQMQTRIVDILREILFREDSYRMTLMTTHSETLLNHCRPEELVITGMSDGRTTAVRCLNAEEVSAEIKRTGFGLGYYYVSDAL